MEETCAFTWRNHHSPILNQYESSIASNNHHISIPGAFPRTRVTYLGPIMVRSEAKLPFQSPNVASTFLVIIYGQQYFMMVKNDRLRMVGLINAWLMADKKFSIMIGFFESPWSRHPPRITATPRILESLIRISESLAPRKNCWLRSKKMQTQGGFKSMSLLIACFLPPIDLWINRLIGYQKPLMNHWLYNP